MLSTFQARLPEHVAPIINPAHKPANHRPKRDAQITKSWRSLHPGGSKRSWHPPGFSGPTWIEHATMVTVEGNASFLNVLDIHIWCQGEGHQKSSKLLRIQPCWLINLTSCYNQTQWNRRKTHDNKSIQKQLVLTMMISITPKQILLSHQLSEYNLNLHRDILRVLVYQVS